jgi:hypothetical protein
MRLSKNIVNQPHSCSICSSTSGFPLAQIHQAPAILGCSKRVRSTDVFINFDIYICSRCGLIQTNARIPKLAYPVVHSHAVGNVWNKHRQNLIKFIVKSGNKGQAFKNILEIGPSVSPISRSFKDFSSITYIDNMNKPPFTLIGKEKYHQGLYPSSKISGKFDLILVSHVLEHSNNLNSFMLSIKSNLSKNGMAVFSIPNFKYWLANKYWNAITSEHLAYPFTDQIKFICNQVGLTPVFSKFLNHSVYFSVSHSSTAQPVPVTFKKLFSLQELLINWVDEINSFVSSVESQTKKTENIILTGASHLSQYLYLISSKVGSSSSICLDNATSKHGQRVYGTNLTVKSFNHLKQIKAPSLVVPPSPYTQEIINQIKKVNSLAKIVS